MSDQNKSKGASPEQLIYADILEKGMYIGLGLMLLTFLIYMTGIMKPAIPVEQISNYWKMPVSAKAGHGAKDSHAAAQPAAHEAAGATATAAAPAKEEPAPKPGYLQSINKDFLHLEKPPTGWAWMNLLGYSDFLNFLPVAMLAGVTILCYAAIIPGLFRRKDTAYAIMAIAEVAILVLAASNLLTVGGH
jgi:hypothetical protein